MSPKPPIDYVDLPVDNTQHPRLADALAQFDAIKDELDELKRKAASAEKAYKAVRQVILDEVFALTNSPGTRILYPALDRPLRMRWQTSSYLDRERLRAEKPEIESYYSYDKGAWYLERQS